jgi:hypothetical protein
MRYGSTHTFEAIDAQRTRVRDRVLYRLPFGSFGRIAHALFVRRALDKIFDHRAKVIADLLAPGARTNEAAGEAPADVDAEAYRRRKAS